MSVMTAGIESRPIAVAEADTADWLAARSTGIGASEIAAAAGISQYMTALELYHRKRGEIPPVVETDAMRLGKLLEPAVKAEWSHRTGRSFLDDHPPMFRHAEHACILATPDGIVTPQEVFEGKTAGFRMSREWGDEGTDLIPDTYVCQTQQQMAVMGAAVCHVAVLFDGRTLKTYVVERNDHLIDLLIAAGLELWERIQNGDPPEPNWTHASTLKLIKELHNTVADTRIELTEGAVAAWLRYEDLGRQVKELESQRDACKAQVLTEIGDHGAGLLGDGKMIRRKLIARAEYTVAANQYIDVRKVNADNGVIVDRESFIPVDAVNIEARWIEAQRLLSQSGATLHGESDETRSRYWSLPGGRKVRVSDHDPNWATREWMDRDGVFSIRVDDPQVKLEVAVASICRAAAVTEKERA